MTDVVNHPEHYTTGRIECIDAIESALTPEEFRGYLKGNIIKYTWRERQKGGVESMQKAMWYIRKFVDVFLSDEEIAALTGKLRRDAKRVYRRKPERVRPPR